MKRSKTIVGVLAVALVLTLAGAAQAGFGDLITGVGVAAIDTDYFNNPATAAVNGNGLDGLGQHNTNDNGNVSWLSNAATPSWIRLDFGSVYNVGDLKIWNMNSNSHTEKGAREFDVYVRTTTETNNTDNSNVDFDSTGYTLVTSITEFPEGPTSPTYTGETPIDLGGVGARLLVIDITRTWRDADPNEVGLAEIQVFEAIPEPATVSLLLMGAAGLVARRRRK